MKRRLSAFARTLRAVVASICAISALFCDCKLSANDWNTDSSGLFGDPLNWTGGVPGINDNADFDRGNAAITVSFDADAVFSSLIQRSGTVTLESVGGSFGVTASNGISVTTGSATAVLKTLLPTLTTHGVLVGNGNGSIGTFDVLAGTVSLTSNDSRAFNIGSSGGIGTVNIQNGAVINNNGGTVLGRQNGNGVVNLIGPGSILNNQGPVTVGEQGNGLMSITQGALVTSNFGDINRGSVTIDGLGSKWINSNGVSVGFDGFLSLVNQGRIDAGPNLFNVGTVSGDGEIHTEYFQNWSTLKLIPSAGGLTVHGDFESLGAISVEIASTAQYGKLTVTGSTALDGILQFSLVNNFAPQSGDSFDVLNANLQGSFYALDFPQLTGGLKWDVSQLNSSGVVSVSTVAADTWKARENGEWFDNSKWLDGSVPTASDAVLLAVGNSGGHTINFSAAPTAIKNFAMTAGRVTFKSTGGVRTLNVTAAGGSHNATISGSGTQLKLGDGTGADVNLNVGNDLIVQAGGVFFADFNSGSEITVGGNVMIDGGGFAAIGNHFHLGNAKTITVQNGGQVSLPEFITPSNTIIHVTGQQSEWFGAIAIVKGSQMSVLAGGSLGFAPQIDVGTDGNGTLLVNGESSLVFAENAKIGGGGSGAFTLSNGSDASLQFVNVADGPIGTTGAVSVLSGATLQTTAIQAAAEIGGQGIATIDVQGTNTVVRFSNARFGNSSMGSAVINVGTTAGGARLESLPSAGHSTVIQKTATVNLGSASTQGEFLAESDVLIDGGLLRVAAGSLFQLGVGKQLTVQNGGRAEIGGNYATGQNGVISLAGATAELQISGLFTVQNGSKVNLSDRNSLEVPGGLVVAHGGQVNLPFGTSLDVAGSSTTLSPQGSLNITGGSANLGTLNAAGGAIQLTSGAVTFLGNLNTGANQPFGPNPTIATNQYVTLDGTTTVSSLNVLTLAGGSLTTGALANNGTFAFNSGTLHITGPQGLTIAAGGPLGSAFTLGPGRTLNLVVKTDVQSAAYFAIDGGASFATGTLNNAGETNLTGAAATLNAATVNNSGLLRGDGRVIASLNNLASGEIRAESGKTLKFIGNGANAGRVNLQGGTIEFTQPLVNAAGLITGHGTITTGGAGLTNSGQINLAGGYTEVLGNVQNQAASPGGIRVLTGSGVTFWNDVANAAGAAFNVSAGSSATFVGDFLGSGISGPGSVEFHGNVSPGFGPARLTMTGNVTFGLSSVLEIELAGTGNNQHDSVQVMGALHLDGTLRVTLLDGFVPALNDSFHILFSQDVTGTFTTLDLPVLPPSLAWHTFPLYSQGTIWIVSNPPIPGDFDGDYDVDGADFVVWQTNYPAESGHDLATGDADYDGDVDGADFVVWQSHFPTPVASAIAPVPEPAGFFIGIVGAAAIVFSGLRRAQFKSRNSC